MIVRRTTALVWFLALAELNANQSLACENAVELTTDRATAIAAASEQSLAEGDTQGAMDQLAELFGGHPQRQSEETGFGYEEDWPLFVTIRRDKKGTLNNRLMRTTAVVVLRLQPHKALDAYGMLDSLLQNSHDDPYLVVRRAESALAFKKISTKVLAEMDQEEKMLKLAENQSAFTQQNLNRLVKGRLLAQAAIGQANQARKTLEKLAAADLLIDAEGYALLSKLRRQAHDAVGAQAALARCQTMANNAVRRCALAEGK